MKTITEHICHHSGLYYSCKLTYAQAVHNFAIGGMECIKQYGAKACNHAMAMAQHGFEALKNGVFNYKVPK